MEEEQKRSHPRENKYTLRAPQPLLNSLNEISEKRGSTMAEEIRRACRVLIQVEESLGDEGELLYRDRASGIDTKLLF